MATLRDFEDVGVIDRRAGPVGFARELGPASQDVHLGDCVRGGEQGFGAGEHLGQQGLENFGFAG